MAKIYYIDSENVGDSWIDLLEETNCRFLVFYTGHSPRIAYPQAIQLMNATNKPEFVDHFYGDKNGENIYKCLKKEKFVAPPVQWTKETRMKKLIELIIKYVNTSKTSIPDSLPGFIVNNIVDDKKAMGNKLNKSYVGSGPQLNKMFKPFYKTLAKIKKK